MRISWSDRRTPARAPTRSGSLTDQKILEDYPAKVVQSMEIRDILTELDETQRVAHFEQLFGKAACRRLGIYELPPQFRLSVVIPVYNERETITEVVTRVRRCGVPCELILVDDASTDGTRELLATWQDQPDLKILFHDRNQGKGAALKTGFQQVTGDAVIVQDADLEYDPAEFRYLLQPIVQDQADAVFGSRFASHSQRVLYFWHYVGNRLLTTLSNCFTNLNLTDMETCYKVFTRATIEKIAPTLREKRFGFEPEITAKVASLPGVKIYERPISYNGRTYSEGKKITWRDGFRALWCIVRYRRGLRGKPNSE
jgi:glycosyltransferase involved in cell wall biosynthesis